MALYSVDINPGDLRELHWHSNAHELAFCLEGHRVFGIFSPVGNIDTFEISGGSAWC
jgi:oxalate decarboxylase/phosphoglucose isomerase-like protein (cupin superfamily)